MRGPKSFEVAGEFSDGCHHALGYTRRAYEYGFEHFRAGAERAGKNPDDLDFAAWVCTAIGRDSAAAKQAARSMVGIYASSMPQELLERNGVDPAELTPIVEAMGAGDLAKSIELTSPELAEKLSRSSYDCSPMRLCRTSADFPESLTLSPTIPPNDPHQGQ
jgi:5,10-methylenetetrahydromethanopterin reductase